MKRYELSIAILENGITVDHKVVYTYAENLDRAQRNIAWRTVVKDNLEAEYPGLAVRFEDGRVIDGGKKTKVIPLYIILMHDLHKQEVHVDEAYAKQLRQKYAVNKNNYAEKLAQIVKDFKAEETKTESADTQKNKEEDMKMEDKRFENYKRDLEGRDEYGYMLYDRMPKKIVEQNNRICSVLCAANKTEADGIRKIFKILNEYDVSVLMGKDQLSLAIVNRDGAIITWSYDNEPVKQRAAVVLANTAIQLGRNIYTAIRDLWKNIEAPTYYYDDEDGDDRAEIVDFLDSRIQGIRTELEELFKSSKVKQETTDAPNMEHVENKIAPVNIKQDESTIQKEGKQVKEKLRNNPYYQMATGSNGWIEQEISIQIETKAGASEIKRKLAWKHGQDGFVSGTIKSLNGITGTWFWNTKKSWHPAIKQCGKVLQYTKERVVKDVPLSNAQKNVNALILAMQKALKENGVYCRIVAESAGINAKNPAAGTKVCGMVVAHKRIVTGPVGHEPTESDFWK